MSRFNIKITEKPFEKRLTLPTKLKFFWKYDFWQLNSNICGLIKDITNMEYVLLICSPILISKLNFQKINKALDFREKAI